MPYNQPYGRSGPLRSARPNVRQHQTANFDTESGQVFNQTSIAVQSRQHSDWIGELKTPSLLKKAPQNGKGACSLVVMARNKTVREFRELTADHFASLPWSVAQSIWQALVDSHGESLHAWRTLATAYSRPSEFGLSRYRYHLDIRQPSLPLESYLNGLTSAKFSWLTALRISPKETRTADLVALSKVSNLAVLDLSDGQVLIDRKSSTFDERVMRAWSELAATGNFRQLRVLLLGWQEHLDQWIFHYLPCFPNLQQVIVTDSPNLHQKNRKAWETVASDNGWEGRHSKRSAKSLRSHLNESEFPLGAISGLYYTTVDSCRTHPLLECWLGTPRKWTHILDDFPGTKTVYFDRVRKVSPPSSNPSVPGVTSKRERERSAVSSTPTSPQPKRAQKPKLRTMKAAVSSGFEDMLAQYTSK